MARAAFIGPQRQQSFGLQLARFVEKAKTNTDVVIRKVAVEMLDRIVDRTPVDTGRARANWQTTIGSPAMSPTGAEDKSGSSAKAAGGAVIASFNIGQTVWLSNALPYAGRLEYGSSLQAPAGMVRVTVAEFQGLVSSLAGQVNR
jgi:hypothetical protein